MTTPAELMEEIEIAAWALTLAPPGSSPAELCRLIVIALAAEGRIVGHAPTPGVQHPLPVTRAFLNCLEA